MNPFHGSPDKIKDKEKPASLKDCTELITRGEQSQSLQSLSTSNTQLTPTPVLPPKSIVKVH